MAYLRYQQDGRRSRVWDHGTGDISALSRVGNLCYPSTEGIVFGGPFLMCFTCELFPGM